MSGESQGCNSVSSKLETIRCHPYSVVYICMWSAPSVDLYYLSLCDAYQHACHTCHIATDVT